MVPETLQQLREYDVTDQSRLKLEFFFYTNAETKATPLLRALQERGYSGECGVSAGNKKQFLVTGWTDKMAMDESSVVAWTQEMCRLGFEHDCEFDGWGTNPHQD